MSRIGKKPVFIPTGVIVKIVGNSISVSSPRGELSKEVHPGFTVELKTITAEGENKSEVIINPVRNDVSNKVDRRPSRRRSGGVNPRVAPKRLSALWGLERSLIANMIEGVHKGFEKKLEFEGIGYRANVEGDTLVMQLGFSHPVRLKAPPNIKFLVEKNVITVSGIDKGGVGEAASRIRAQKPPEPYQGKGIRYQGEIIRRKAGKKAVASA